MVVGNSVQVVFADTRFIGSPNANITSLSISMRCYIILIIINNNY